MNAPLLVLDQSSPIPPYEQIGSQIRALIVGSHLPPGSLLPSVRQLARDLGIAPNTVVRAYNELEHDGWVISSARKGVIVAEQLLMITEQEQHQRLQQAVEQLLMTAHQLGVDDVALYQEIDRQIYTHKQSRT